MNNPLISKVEEKAKSSSVVIFMKGTPQFPQCGFSSRTSQALKACGVSYVHVNVLEDGEIYETLPKFSDWPTFPQVYINGELIGGCDITLELYQKGELQKMTQAAAAKNPQTI